MEHWFIDQKSSQHGSQNPKTTVSKYPNKHNQCNTCSDSVQLEIWKADSPKKYVVICIDVLYG